MAGYDETCGVSYRHPATPLEVSIADVKAAGGNAIEGVSAVDAIATYLDARRRLEVIEFSEACKLIHLSSSQTYS